MFSSEMYLIDLKSKFDKIDFNKYYLSYSGGRDSHFLYWFIKEYLKDDTIEIVGSNTYMEHSQILKRINQNSDHVVFPDMKPKEIKAKYGSPCYSKMHDEYISRYQRGNRSNNTMNYINSKNPKFVLPKYIRKVLHKIGFRISNKCCDILKKKPLKKYGKLVGKKAILGVRGCESQVRHFQYNKCFSADETFTPIFDLTEDILKKIERDYGIEIPEIYDHIDRTGCMGCVYGKNIEKELSLINNDKQLRFILDYHKEAYKLKGINTEVMNND